MRAATNLKTRGLVPLRHLRDGGLGLEGPVTFLCDGVDDRVLGIQIALGVGIRNTCRKHPVCVSNWWV